MADLTKCNPSLGWFQSYEKTTDGVSTAWKLPGKTPTESGFSQETFCQLTSGGLYPHSPLPTVLYKSPMSSIMFTNREISTNEFYGAACFCSFFFCMFQFLQKHIFPYPLWTIAVIKFYAKFK